VQWLACVDPTIGVGVNPVQLNKSNRWFDITKSGDLMGRALDIDVLRTFQAVARFRRFKDAADYVHRSPSAVTTQIQKLEAKVGHQLLVRNNQLVELTPAGRQLLGETTRFLMAHDRLLATLSPQLMTGKVRMGVPDGYAEQLMADFLPLFVAGNPALELEVVVKSSTELLDLFARKQLDLTIAVSHEQLSHAERLRSTQPCWAAAAGFKYDPDQPLPIAHCPAIEWLPVPGVSAGDLESRRDPLPDPAGECQFPRCIGVCEKWFGVGHCGSPGGGR
jgi:DNA-binding transcriptional LysR family regulator